MQSVDGKFVVRELRASVIALIPKLLSILGNMATTSHETKRFSLGKGPNLFRSSIFCKRCVVSLTKDGNFWAKGSR